MQRRRLNSSAGRLDAATLEQLGLEQALSMLVEAAEPGGGAARDQGDDETLAGEIARAPELQRDGRFVGAAEIKRRLELSGVSNQEFEEGFRSRLMAQRLQALFTDGLNVTSAEAEKEFRRRTEQVKAEYVLVPVERFKGQEQATEDEVRARFEANKETYRLPEKRVVSYLLLDPASMESRVAVTEPELTAYYQEHGEEYKAEEQTCASHILVKVKATPEAKEGHPEEEARQLAQGALDQLTAGADFASLARKISEDQGSAPSGGDLSCFGRGRMLPEFENAAFDLKPGETSGLVKSAYGYHLIRVSAHREEDPHPDRVKDRIRQVVLSQTAGLAEEDAGGGCRAAWGRSLEEVARQGSRRRSQPFSAAILPPWTRRSWWLRLSNQEGRSSGRSPHLGATSLSPSPGQDSRLPALRNQDKVKTDVVDSHEPLPRRMRSGPGRAGGSGEGRHGRGPGTKSPQPVGQGNP